MAKPEHLAVLIEKGVEGWNRWREQKSNTVPELSEANLVGEYLIGANFARADLSGAFLTSANLRKANLTGTNLKKAKLSEANLTSAKLDRKAHV